MLLDLNDTCLTLRDQRGVHYAAAAYALQRDEALVYGEPAITANRLHPLLSNNVYLDRLSAEPLPRALGAASNHADLLYHQLREVAEAADKAAVTVLVPSTLTADQLSLFLGVASEAELHIGRFVDAAVLAAACTAAQGNQLWVLDLSLHHLLLTEVALEGKAERRDAQALPGAGLHQLLEGWLNLVADRFIDSTRFDPLHQAASEQQVFDQLAQYSRLNQLAPASPIGAAGLSINIDLQGETRRVVVAQEALIEKTQQRLASSFSRLPEHGTCLLMPRLAQTPTLLEALNRARPEVRWLVPTATGDGYLRSLLQERPQLLGASEEVQLLQQLDRQQWLDASAAGNTKSAEEVTPPTARHVPATGADQGEPGGALATLAAQAAERPPPTHLLQDGVAKPVDRCLFELGLPLARSGASFVVMPSDEPMLHESTVIPVGTELASGFSFSWAGHALQLIAIADR